MKTTKKLVALVLCAVIAICFASCSNKQDNSLTTGEITVISREDGSGTRGAFVELFGIEENDKDNTTVLAEITNSTAVMMTTVAGNKQSIGYISLGSLNDTIKALKIDGAYPSAENVENGTYKIVRPFNIATRKDGLTEQTKDFIQFILSVDGQKIVSEEKYISIDEPIDYQASDVSGKITISGSSSVTPVMEKLKEAYCELNKNVKIELQQTDSSTGMTDAINGVSDIGMASRELKAEELVTLNSTLIAKDGIAVIVNNQNSFDSLSSEQIKQIFKGEITDWSQLQ